MYEFRKAYLFGIALLGIGLLSGGAVWAQQVTIFNQNIANPFSVNPSQAGIEQSQILFHHRSQWVGIMGAPEKTLLTSEWRIGKGKTGVGFSAQREQANVIANTSAYATVARHFALKGGHQLSFGASAGVRYNSIDFARVNAQDPDDNLIFNDRQSAANFDARFGLGYRFKGLDVQASGLQLFGNKVVYDNSFDQDHLEYRFVRHFVLSAGYQFQATKDIGLKPIVQLRGVEGFALQPEAILRVDLKNRLWVAGHYRHKAAAAVSFGVVLSDRYVLGYSGELATTNVAGYNGGTHEIMFGIRLGSTFKGDAQEKEVAEIRENARSYEERLQYLQEANRKLNETVAQQRERLDKLKQGGQKLDYAEVRKIVKQETDEALRDYEKRNPPGEVKVVPVEPAPAQSWAMDGATVVAMTKPYYVVIASAKSEKKAQKAVRQAEKQFGLRSFVIHPEGSNYYFVSTGGYDDREALRTALKDALKAKTEKKFNGKPWVVERK